MTDIIIAPGDPLDDKGLNARVLASSITNGEAAAADMTIIRGTDSAHAYNVTKNHFILPSTVDRTGATDATTDVQSALPSAGPGDEVHLGRGTLFMKSGFVYPNSGVKISGDSTASLTLLGGQDQAFDQAIIRVSTIQKNGVGFVGDLNDVEICNMTLDTNFLTHGWTGGARQMLIASNPGDTISNCKIHNIHFTDNSSAVPIDDVDTWGILNQPRGLTKELRIYDCLSDQPWHQFIGGGGTEFDGYHVYRNKVYHARDNGISLACRDDGVSMRNVKIYNNTIDGYTLNAILIGVDGSQIGLNLSMDNIEIANNSMTANSFKETIGTVLYQSPITVFAPGNHLTGLNIHGNVATRAADSTVSNYYGALVGTLNVQPTYTLNASFSQPAVGATVSGVTFTATLNLAVGNVLHMGSGSIAGGRYEVTANLSEFYTLTRLPWTTGSPASTTIATSVSVRQIGEIREANIFNNILGGQLRLDYMTKSKVIGNRCRNATEAQYALLDSCYDIDVDNNTFEYDTHANGYGRIELLKSNKVRIRGNTFGGPSTSLGTVQQKANPDDLGRETHIDCVMEGNEMEDGFTATNHTETQQTTISAGTHSLQGSLRSARTPETYIIGDVGCEVTNVNGGAGTTKFVKESGAGTKTGWVGK